MLTKKSSLSNTTPLEYPEQVCLVHSGDDYFERLERIINEAKNTIHLQTYIFSDDATGRPIIEALKKAAQRKVAVFLLLDGFGSLYFPKIVIQEMQSVGIQFRYFSPLFSASSFYWGRRLHKKVVVADQKVALIGGINISNRYKGSAEQLPWLDYAVEINCPIAKSIQQHCEASFWKDKTVLRKKIAAYRDEENTIRILFNDWLHQKNEISKSYIQSISEAKEKIIIVGSYFLPGIKLINALQKAAKNKVRIQLILSGISDVPLARRASGFFYSKLLRHSIEIYEWNSSVLHGKAAVIDTKWCTIGSFNLNNLSSFASIEMNVGIDSPIFAALFEEELNRIIEQCQPITPENFKIRNTLVTQFLTILSYIITRTFEIVLTYFPFKKFKNR